MRLSTEMRALPGIDLSGLWSCRPGRAPLEQRGRELRWPELAELARPAAAPEAAQPGAEPALLFTEGELARLCAAAAARAAAEVRARLQEEQARERLAVQARLAAALTGLSATLAARRAELEAEAAAIGAELGRALAHDALRQNPTAVAMAVMRELLAELRAEPEIVVEVPAEDHAELEAGLAALAHDCGCAGALVLLPSEVLRRGELRVRWRDGWAERLLDAAQARVLAARGDAAGPPMIDEVEIAETGG